MSVCGRYRAGRHCGAPRPRRHRHGRPRLAGLGPRGGEADRDRARSGGCARAERRHPGPVGRPDDAGRLRADIRRQPPSALPAHDAAHRRRGAGRRCARGLAGQRDAPFLAAAHPRLPRGAVARPPGSRGAARGLWAGRVRDVEACRHPVRLRARPERAVPAVECVRPRPGAGDRPRARLPARRAARVRPPRPAHRPRGEPASGPRRNVAPETPPLRPPACGAR